MNFPLIVGIGIVILIVALLVLRKLLSKADVAETEGKQPEISETGEEGSEVIVAPAAEEAPAEEPAIADDIKEEAVAEEPEVTEHAEDEESIAVEPSLEAVDVDEPEADLAVTEVEQAEEADDEVVPEVSSDDQQAETPDEHEQGLDEIETMEELEATEDEVEVVEVEEESVAVEEEVVSIDFDEDILPEEIIAEEKAEEPPVEESVVEEVEPEPAEQPVAEAEEEVPVVAPVGIKMSLEEYSVLLNAMDEDRRMAVNSNVGDSQQQQLELVIVNERLAQLEDSYGQEVTRRSGALAGLERLQGEVDSSQHEEAIQGVRTGNTKAAEKLFDSFVNSDSLPAGMAAFLSGQLAECRIDLHRALERYTQAIEQDGGNAEYLRAAGVTARLLYRYKEAVPWLESFVAKVGIDKPGTEELALGLRELAYTYVISGQYKKAGPLYKQSMGILSSLHGPEHPEMAISWFQIGELQETLGEYDKAVSLYKQALSILEKKRGEEHPSLAVVLDKLARICTELEMERDSIPLYERLVKIREKALRPNHPLLAMGYNNLAESYRMQGQYDLAENCYKQCLNINEEVQGKEHPAVGAVLQELAKLCTSQKKHEEAEEYQKRATAIFDRTIELAEKESGSQSLTLD